MSDYAVHISRIQQTALKLDFQLNKSFFESAPEGLIRETDLHAHLKLRKVRDGIAADMDLQGQIGTNCDRCLQDIDFPVDVQQQLLYTTKTNLADDNPTTVILLDEEQEEIDLAQDLYDFALLQIPYKKVCEDVGMTCDEAALEALEENASGQSNDNASSIDPRWAALEQLKNKN